MNEKNKFRTNRLLLILAILSFVVATLEGIIYYANQEVFFRVLMIIQNSINAFAFKPAVSLSDAMKFMESNPDTFNKIVGYSYGIAVFTAPYCTLTVVYKLLDKLLRFMFRIRRKKKDSEQIVIFGYNDDVKSLIKSYSQEKAAKYCIHIVTDMDFSSDERYNLSKIGYLVHNFNILNADEKDISYLLSKAGCDKADNIILFDENSINNFSILQVFSLKSEDGGFKLKAGTKITCRCEDDSIAELIADYYRIEKNAEYGYDLEIVSLPELQVRKMYNDVPLYTYYKNSKKPLCEWDTHLLVIGFGSIVQNALLQAINLGVMHSSNRIVIDVYDTDIDSRMGIFSNRFNPDSFEMIENKIIMSKDIADGYLEINCHKMNVRFREFIEEIRVENKRFPYTYAVVAIDDINIGVNCAMRLSAVFNEQEKADVPIILRMDSDRQLAKYIGQNKRTLSSVRLLEDRSVVLTLDLILNREINQKAKDFHYFYSTIQVLSQGEQAWGTSGDPDILWNSTPLFKRNSSKALAAHDTTKQVIFTKLAEEMGEKDADTKINELIGENGTLMRYNEGVWHLRQDDHNFLLDLKKDEYAHSIAVAEHRRWCCFMASEGWRYGSERNDNRKIHSCLLTFENLEKDKKGQSTIKYDLMPMMSRYLRNNG